LTTWPTSPAMIGRRSRGPSGRSASPHRTDSRLTAAGVEGTREHRQGSGPGRPAWRSRRPPRCRRNRRLCRTRVRYAGARLRVRVVVGQQADIAGLGRHSHHPGDVDVLHDAANAVAKSSTVGPLSMLWQSSGSVSETGRPYGQVMRTSFGNHVKDRLRAWLLADADIPTLGDFLDQEFDRQEDQRRVGQVSPRSTLRMGWDLTVSDGRTLELPTDHGCG
jgi:hypothetical protein